MYNGLLHLHNLLRWVILILLVFSIIRQFTAGNKPFTSVDKKSGLWLMISAHLTLLIGIYQWFAGNWGYTLIKTNGMGEVMKNAISRFWVIEHPIGMLIAIVLITIGRGVAKKDLPDGTKHKRMAIMYTIALLIILAIVPWGFREVGIQRAWFPGMS